ncbi:hypothetical protein A2781_00825 [Candidatus Gottesmanbacteria bacterium RIFCSPHIGHO2_01_FULL_42_27]|nr:MAG: hypothetical protein A2781_00825 [Candidatus Gottesmanbacteria bacterium RIFCSPHIGHO2_01_FULL_42_27]OGG22518.1 MAG: hypothetical protein A3E72_03665 [Candidatus Gottesmanbacteria bacterium RIFCSPHIGHO2_12_FULL_43_26]OGG34888.1 MAG: hypothetical protein A3G68_04415 [Candidatus Gottesmanbacteria bacterium RIFCSPLOWO2_12_FULL_42_10]
MKKKLIPAKLPPSLHFFFWDCDVTKLNPAKKPYYVINRLLDKGNLAAVRWVRRNFPEELIIETIKKMRDFSSKTVIFWSRLLNIPIEEIKCMREPYRSMRKMHWPN